MRFKLFFTFYRRFTSVKGRMARQLVLVSRGGRNIIDSIQTSSEATRLTGNPDTGSLIYKPISPTLAPTIYVPPSHYSQLETSLIIRTCHYSKVIIFHTITHYDQFQSFLDQYDTPIKVKSLLDNDDWDQFCAYKSGGYLVQIEFDTADSQFVYTLLTDMERFKLRWSTAKPSKIFARAFLLYNII